MPAQMLEEWRTKARERVDKAKARIEEWRAGREGGASRTRTALSPQGLVKEVREKGLVETYRTRREAWRGQHTSTQKRYAYGKDIAIEASTAPQLKIQKGRVAIEA